MSGHTGSQIPLLTNPPARIAKLSGVRFLTLTTSTTPPPPLAPAPVPLEKVLQYRRRRRRCLGQLVQRFVMNNFEKSYFGLLAIGGTSFYYF